MKKNIILLSLLMVLTSFIFAIPTIDLISGKLVYDAISLYDFENYERIGLSIESTKEAQQIANKIYFSDMDKLAKENNLAIYVISQISNNENQPEVVVYTSSNEAMLSKWMMLEKGYAKGLANKEIYSTYATDKEHRIINFMMNVNLSVRPLADIERKGIYMNFINLEGDFQANLQQFFNDFAKIYGKINVLSPYTSSKADLHKFLNAIITVSFDDIGLKFSVSIVLIVLLGLKIFSYTRKISIMKIEGFTTGKIYQKLFFNDFIKYSLAFLLLAISLIDIIYHANLISMIVIAGCFLIQLLQMLIFMMIISLLMYLLIFYTPIMSSFKGRNYLSQVQNFAYFVKFVIVLLILPLVTTTFESVQNLFIIRYRHDKVYELLENRYAFGVQDSSSAYFADIGTDNYIAVKEKLAENGQLFEQSRAILMDWNAEIFDPENGEPYYDVDKYFLINHDMDDDCNLNEICIFFPKNQDYDIEKWKSAARAMVRDTYNINILEYDQPLEAYAINDLLYRDFISELPILYLPEEKGYEGQLNSSMLIFDGNLNEAQAYVDKVFIDHGYLPYFKIESLQDGYQSYYQLYNTLYLKNSLQFSIMIIAYVLANRLLIEVDIDNNRMLYELSGYEGVSPYRFGIYLLKIVSPSLLALLGCIFAKKVLLKASLMIVIIFIIIIELALYLLYNYKYTNIRRFK
ncbi:MAG: hypothetical protein MR210_08400 [Erysipelotrichaceae bacterium]|nr:hypothetical protein [Erysipelotrichaceae bacterium]MDY5251219.1 hypothetical protein [Erysipelotrichaceae bacterium]